MSSELAYKGVLAVGHVLLDIIGKVDTFSSILNSKAPRSPHIESNQMHEIINAQGAIQTKKRASLSRTLGGSAAVTAMTTASLGIESSFLGSVGNDREGDELKKIFAQAGTRFSSLASNQDTGIFLSLTDSTGRHIMRVSPSAAIDVRKLKIDDSDLQPGWILYIDGLLIDAGPWIDGLVRRARQRGMMIALDISTLGNAKTHAQELRVFTETYCDLVFGNSMEVEAVYGSTETKRLNLPFILVEKRGAEGAILYKAGRKICMAAQKVDVLDTTCAGDALAAGYIKALIEGRNAEECLGVGIMAASIAIQYPGSGFDQNRMKDCVYGALATKLGKYCK